MQVGLIGLGKMGINIGQNLIDHQHKVVAFDVNVEAIEEMKKYGAEGTASIQELVQSLHTPRVIWVIVPHKVVDSVISEIKPFWSRFIKFIH